MDKSAVVDAVSEGMSVEGSGAVVASGVSVNSQDFDELRESLLWIRAAFYEKRLGIGCHLCV
jgi:hypothetical protein